MRYRPDLDGIRALAVLIVIGRHSPFNAFAGGWMGVDIFFVLSGYLITTLLLAERRNTGTVSVSRFYMRRLLRLYPALMLMLILGLPFYRDLGDGPTVTGYARAATIAGLYLEDFFSAINGVSVGLLGHTWSLAVEEQYYLLWPPLLLWLLRRNHDPLRWAAGGTVISWALLALGSGTNGASGIPDVYTAPWSRFSQLLIGCCVALLIERRALPDWVCRRWVGWTAAIAAVVLWVVGGRISTTPHLAWEAPLIALLTSVLIAHLAGIDGGLRSILSWGPLVFAGRRSYGIYLFHYPAFIVVTNHLHRNRFEVFALELAITLALAILSYRFVELPFLRLKHRRFEPPSHQPEPVPT